MAAIRQLARSGASGTTETDRRPETAVASAKAPPSRDVPQPALARPQQPAHGPPTKDGRPVKAPTSTAPSQAPPTVRGAPPSALTSAAPRPFRQPVDDFDFDDNDGKTATKAVPPPASARPSSTTAPAPRPAAKPTAAVPSVKPAVAMKKRKQAATATDPRGRKPAGSKQRHPERRVTAAHDSDDDTDDSSVPADSDRDSEDVADADGDAAVHDTSSDSDGSVRNTGARAGDDEDFRPTKRARDVSSRGQGEPRVEGPLPAGVPTMFTPLPRKRPAATTAATTLHADADADSPARHAAVVRTPVAQPPRAKPRSSSARRDMERGSSGAGHRPGMANAAVGRVSRELDDSRRHDDGSDDSFPAPPKPTASAVKAVRSKSVAPNRHSGERTARAPSTFVRRSVADSLGDLPLVIRDDAAEPRGSHVTIDRRPSRDSGPAKAAKGHAQNEAADSLMLGLMNNVMNAASTSDGGDDDMQVFSQVPSHRRGRKQKETAVSLGTNPLFSFHPCYGSRAGHGDDAEDANEAKVGCTAGGRVGSTHGPARRRRDIEATADTVRALF